MDLEIPPSLFGELCCTFKHQLFLQGVISGPKNLHSTTSLSMSHYGSITVGAGVCMTVFCMSFLLCVHLRARAGA